MLELAAVAALVMATGQAASASLLAWDITGGSVTGLGGTPRANGAQFSVAGPATVTSLGIWDDGGDGLAEAHVVRLWTDAGSLLAEATVNNGSTAVSSTSTLGLWLFADITPVALTAGTYRIAVGYATSADPVRFGTTVVTDIGAHYMMQAFTSGLAGVSAFPNNLNTNVLFGANLMLDSAVPEPGSVTLLLSGIALFAWRMRGRSV